MREITLDIDEEIEKAKSAYEKAKESKESQETLDELEAKLGNLEVIKDEHGNFKVTFKKYTAREQSTLQEIAMGIRGGVKSTGAGFVSNPSIINSHINSIKFGIKNIEPVVFDFRNEQAIGELDKTLDDWIYGMCEEFNTKNWKFRQTVG